MHLDTVVSGQDSSPNPKRLEFRAQHLDRGLLEPPRAGRVIENGFTVARPVFTGRGREGGADRDRLAVSRR